MKTKGLINIAGILAISILSLAVLPEVSAAALFKEKKVNKEAHLSFDEATQNSGILQAMYEQIELDYFPEHWPYLTVRIKYRSVNYFIQGTYDQWYFFFRDRASYMQNRQR